MRCPDCSKFVGLELQDPEDINLDVESTLDGDQLSLSVSMTARIVRNCAECGQELKEANIEANENVEIEACTIIKCVRVVGEAKVGDLDSYDWLDDKHGEPEINETNVEQIEEGGGRYAKSFFGANVSYVVKCKCGETLHEGEISDKCAASSMEELV